MDVDRLREFISVADAGSFTEGGRKLGISQPLVSRHISQLEHDVGERLFERDNNHVALTLAGRVLLRDARRIVATCDEADARFKAFKKSRKHHLAVELFKGYKPTDDLVKLLEAQFDRDGLYVEMAVRDIVGQDPVVDVLDGAADIAVIGASPHLNAAGLRVITYIEEPFVAIVGKNHPLACRDELDPCDLEHTVVWLSEGPRYLYAYLKDLLAQRGVHPDYQVKPWESAREMYASMPYDALGVRLTFASNAKHAMPALQDSCRALRFSDPAMVATVVALCRAGDDNPACASAMGHIEDIARTADMSVYWS